ncbi:hypothetical protein Hdeb2414_s0002g00075271 [Helianthus debilis subsp. tardiflorus]
MAHNNKQMDLNSTEEANVQMRRSFSWDRAFFTSDGFLDAEELTSVIQGSGDEVNHQLQKIEEIESLEAKLFEEIEASTRASNVSRSNIDVSSRKKDSRAKNAKVASTAAASSSSTPLKTSSSSGSSGSQAKKVKSPVRKSASFKSGKGEGDSPSKTSTAIGKRNNLVAVSTRMLKTPPASPGSSGSSKSMFSVNQRSKRSTSAPRRTSVNSEKPSGIDARRNDECKTAKNKMVRASSRMSNTPPASPGSSGSSKPTFSVNQWSKRSSSAPRRTSGNSEKPSVINTRRNDEWKVKKNNAGISSPTFSVSQGSKRSSSVPRKSSTNSEKPSASNARRNDEWKTTKHKVGLVSTRMSSTPPASPKASGSSSSSSMFTVDQRSKRSSSAPRRSSVNNEKPSPTNARKTDEWKINKPEVRLIPKTQSSISLKIKPPPVVSLPTSPLGLFNSSSSSRAQRSYSSSPSSSSASSTCKVNQRSTKPVVRSKSALKHRPTGQITDQNQKQLVASRPETRSPNASKTINQVQKTTTPKPSRKQSSVKEKSSSSISKGAENVILVSPEVMDIKGKLNALKMEISMQKGRQIQGNRNEPR